MEYITGSVVIEKGTVVKDGKLIFAADPTNFFQKIYQHFDWQYPKFFKMDNLSRLGWAAAELLVEGSTVKTYQPEEVAVVLSNSNSSLDTDYKYTETTWDIPSPSVFVYTLPNIVTGEICIRHHFKGENAFFLSESFDPELLTKYVSNLLETKIARVCITGWVELLGDSYKAALYLIEKTGTMAFSAEQMDRIFKNSTH